MNDLQPDKRPAAQAFKEKVSEVREEAKQRADDALKASREAARESFSELADAAKDVADHTSEQVQEQLAGQQEAGADYLGRFAEDIRSSAKAFERDAPFAARGLEAAAGYVAGAATKIREGSFKDLVGGATSFARAQPVAFLGLSMLAGFAAVRFLKAGGETDGKDAHHE